MSEICDNVIFIVPPPPPPLPLSIIKVNVTEPVIEESESKVISYIKQLYQNLKPDSDEVSLTIVYKHLKSLIQDGPTCGLVALSMISSCTPRMILPSDLLHLARQQCFTKKGEMFSALNMTLLASETVGRFFEIKLNHGGLLSDQECIISNLLNGNLYLLPYDADKNHSPANLKGLKAHWAILCGVVKSSTACFVIAKQSKSKHVALWDLNALHDSNMNLAEIDNEKVESGDYVIDDLKNSLAGKYILFKCKQTVEN